jgi:hypothetical protein
MVLVGNDEFAPRQYKCEFQRIWNIAHALQQTEEYHDVPLLYIRFNPHFFKIGKRFFDVKLEEAHGKLLQYLESIKPEQIRSGVNLVYVHYDRDESNDLMIFNHEHDEDADVGFTHFSDLYQNCVMDIL